MIGLSKWRDKWQRTYNSILSRKHIKSFSSWMLIELQSQLQRSVRFSYIHTYIHVYLQIWNYTYYAQFRGAGYCST